MSTSGVIRNHDLYEHVIVDKPHESAQDDENQLEISIRKSWIHAGTVFKISMLTLFT